MEICASLETAAGNLHIKILAAQSPQIQGPRYKGEKAEGFNLKIEMVRDMILMQGHGICNHRYLWKE